MAEIKVEGIDPIILKIKHISDPAAYTAAVGRACAVVERAAKEKAPKNTGELRRSITSRVESDGTGIVFTPLEYAPYIEFGTGLYAENGNGRTDVPWYYQDDEGEWHSTSGMHPHPFLRPALEENRKKIVEILKEGLKK